MKSSAFPLVRLIRLFLLATWFAAATCSQSAELLNFGFNEGSGTTVADSASGLTGRFGLQHDPAVDYVQLVSDSPSGQPGDRCITNSGLGFLLVDDAIGPVLNITNG